MRLFSLGLSDEPSLDLLSKTARVFLDFDRGGVRRILSNLAVVKKELLGKSWQRCKVHFIRNILAKVPHKEERRFAAHLKQIWLQPDKKSAPQAAMQLVQEYGERFPDAIRCLEEGLKDLLQF